jgi:hypothetical protein
MTAERPRVISGFPVEPTSIRKEISLGKSKPNYALMAYLSYVAAGAVGYFFPPVGAVLATFGVITTLARIDQKGRMERK